MAATVWWVLQLGGLIPSTWFLMRFRPQWPIRRPSLIVNGLVLVAWLAYVKAVIVVLLRGGTPTFVAAPDTIASLFLAAVGDTLLALMLATFLKYRRDWQERLNEEDPR
ncbi:hypothetical protein AB0395_41150 [Streptosporangium sp. NPDC051023]|uniref:hypothetical protein n=1 Tax=Streptosporangium sp. NPDC051023 TaxID=3155410 RepID=UPI00344B8E16